MADQQNDLHNNSFNKMLVAELIKEKRADRRWRIFRFIVLIILLAWLIGSCKFFFDNKKHKHVAVTNYVALIRLDGMIAPGRNFSSENVLPILEDAFEDKMADGVVIDINSPGGTPVQASIIHDAIIAFKKKYHKKVVVVGEDLLTSGAYFISVAADKIYVNPNTITGSIGVIMKGFGFVEAMKKLGIERRVYTVGTAKDRLDPFLPQNPEDLQKIQSVMNEVHQNFEQAVIEGRKGKLTESTDKLFTGDFWSGQAALRLGLVDGLGNLLDVQQKEFANKDYKEFGGSSSFWRMLGGEFRTTLDTLVYT